MDKDIITFLIKAKRVTYAGKGSETKASRPNSHDFEYQDGDLRYIDTYIGDQKFAVEEALWNNNKPFWAMNYCGRTLSDEFEGNFLKEALYNVSEDNPFRGPVKFKKGDFEYRCTISGDFTWFNGVEKIYEEGKKVYECGFHCGLIS